MKSKHGFALIELLILATLAATIAGIIYVVGPWGCAANAEAMGRPHKWTLATGCFIEAKPGQWVPLKQYRVID